MYSFMGGGLFCAWVGTILLVVATATDHWMQYRLSGAFAHQGLWRYCLGSKCYLQTESIGEAPGQGLGCAWGQSLTRGRTLRWKGHLFADGEPCGSGRESVQPKVIQRGRGRTGISVFFSSTITGCTDLEVK